MSARPNYGVDGWAYMAGLLAAGTALLAGAAVLASRTSAIALVLAFLAAACLVPGLWGLYYVRTGKFRHRDRLLERFDWRGNERCLDVGTGGGLMAIGAARRAARGSAIGIDVWSTADLSGNAPARALENARLEGVGDRVHVQSQDARSLTFADDEFDVVFAVLCLHNIEPESERHKALRQMVRVTRPGGSIVISDLNGIADLARALSAAGLQVERAGPYWDTFPPQTVVLAKK